MRCFGVWSRGLAARAAAFTGIGCSDRARAQKPMTESEGMAAAGVNTRGTFCFVLDRSPGKIASQIKFFPLRQNAAPLAACQRSRAPGKARRYRPDRSANRRRRTRGAAGSRNPLRSVGRMLTGTVGGPPAAQPGSRPARSPAGHTFSRPSHGRVQRSFRWKPTRSTR